MSKIWPHDKIHELILRAETEGESEAELANAEAARQFRFAIYNFRKQQGIGQELTITLNGRKVLLRKIEPPSVVISAPPLRSVET